MTKKIFLFVFLSLFGHLFAQTDGFSKNTDLSQTYYKIFGKGTPILIINGGPGMNSNGFEPMAKILAEKHQTIVYDQRGTGKSTLKELNDKTVSMKLMTDDIESQGNSAINSLLWGDMQKTNFDCKNKLSNFKNPVLIIQGKQDIVSKEIGEIGLKAFPNSKMVLLENCKHYGWLDAKEKYFDTIESFLKS